VLRPGAAFAPLPDAGMSRRGLAAPPLLLCCSSKT